MRCKLGPATFIAGLSDPVFSVISEVECRGVPRTASSAKKGGDPGCMLRGLGADEYRAPSRAARPVVTPLEPNSDRWGRFSYRQGLISEAVLY